MPKYTVLDFAEDVLTSAPKPLLYQEVWELGEKKGLAKKLGLTSKTPWSTVGARMFVDVRDNPKSPFYKVSKNPARFFLKSRKSEITTTITAASEEGEPDAAVNFPLAERELHPLLAYFANTNLAFNRGRAIYTKTVFHERSKKLGPSEWVHPDMVGVYMPIEDWSHSLLELSRAAVAPALKFYSFELKRTISKSNYRESFFQAVSNSSWAHEGYLVTARLSLDEELEAELERLTAAFGIGLIVLDLEDMDESRVAFPARPRQALDWETMNKLCLQNPDFEHFIKDVRADFTTHKIHRDDYDAVIEDPGMYVATLKRKQR